MAPLNRWSIFAVCGFVLAVAFLSTPAHASAAIVEKGTNMTPLWSGDMDTAAFKSAMQKFKADSGNAISFIIPISQSNLYSTDIHTNGQTPTDSSLANAIAYAHSLGLRVILQLHLDSQDGQWRANIAPGDRATWFANYATMAKHYAAIAQATGAESFIVGSELIKMAAGDENSQNTPGWRSIISQVRSVYSGQVTYAANWGPQGAWNDEKNRIAFWDATDYVAIDAYFKLGNDFNDNSVATFVNAWRSIDQNDLSQLHNRTGKRIVFTEVGYKSTSGDHLDPGDYTINNGVNLTEQNNAYEALFSYWSGSSYMSGVYLWDWMESPNSSGQDTNYSPQNKPAEQTMIKWFSGSGSTTPPSGTPAIAASAQSATVAVNTPSTITASVTNSGQASSGLIVDIELYDQSGNRVLQKFYDNESLAAGQTKQYTASWTPTTQGTYQIRVGVFGPGWAPNYAWNGNAGTITVTSGTQPPPTSTSTAPATFTASASAPAQTTVNQPMSFSASAKDTGGAAQALVDVEVYDSSGAKKFQQFFGAQNFAAGETKTYNLSWTPTATGNYRITSAVFSNDWSKTYVWNNQAATFSVVSGTTNNPPPPPPENNPPPPPPPTGTSPLHNGNVQVVQVNIPKSPVPVGQRTVVGAALQSQGDNANNVSVHVELLNSSGAIVAQSSQTADILHDSSKSFSLSASLPAGSYTLQVTVYNNADGLINKQFSNLGTVVWQ